MAKTLEAIHHGFARDNFFATLRRTNESGDTSGDLGPLRADKEHTACPQVPGPPLMSPWGIAKMWRYGETWSAISGQSIGGRSIKGSLISEPSSMVQSIWD
jgi:hypothetical protein